VAEVLTNGFIETLEEYQEDEELPDLDAEPDDGPEDAETRWKSDRKEWEWEEEARSFRSKGIDIFPEANYIQFKDLSPADLFDLFFSKEILELITTKSCQYAMAKFGMLVTISAEDIRVFLAILILSGYNKVTDFTLFWSNSDDTGNKLIKGAMSRDRFHLIKRCFHMGDNMELEGDRSVVDFLTFFVLQFLSITCF